MIYGRFGGEVKIARHATLADVQALDFREPDQQDRDALANKSYIVVTGLNGADDQVERLYHLAYLRADGGSLEIAAEGDAL